MENVQPRATKTVTGLKYLTYEERLRRLELPTLAYRRLKNDMIEMFKYFKFHDRSTIPLSFTQNGRPSRKHDYQLLRKTARDGVRGPQNNSFIYRTTKIWNDLPQRVVNAKTTSEFKSELDNAWRAHPLHYTIESDS